jgi:hypothetical protein
LQILGAIFNPKIELDPWLWKLPEVFGPCSLADQMSTIESLKSRNLAKVPTLIKNPHLNLPQIQSTYHKMRADCAKMGYALSKVPYTISSLGNPTTSLSLPSRKLHVRYQTAYGTLLCITILLNAILYIYEPLNHSLLEESAIFVDEAITLAVQASQYRPLGSSSTPLCLVAALATTDDITKQAQVKKLLAEYQTDFASTTWLEMAIFLRAKLKRSSAYM